MATGPRRRADVARGSTAPLRRGAEGHVAGRVWPARGAGGADAWQEATRTVHVGARVGRHVAAGGSHVEGPRV